MSRHIKPGRARKALPAQLPAELVTNERPHAVPEKCVRAVEMRTKNLRYGLHERLKTDERRFREPALTSGELDRTYLHLRRWIATPGPEE